MNPHLAKLDRRSTSLVPLSRSRSRVPPALTPARTVRSHAGVASYVHSWRSDDVVMWDNRATMHRGRPWPAHEARLMVRTTISATGADGVESMIRRQGRRRNEAGAESAESGYALTPGVTISLALEQQGRSAAFGSRTERHQGPAAVLQLRSTPVGGDDKRTDAVGEIGPSAVVADLPPMAI